MVGQPDADGLEHISLPAIDMLPHGEKGVSPLAIAILVILPFLILYLKRIIYPTFDPREPPVLRPTVPVVGHMVAMVKERSSWHKRLHDESPLPICTVPMLLGRIYVINRGELIAAAVRNPNISIDPFLVGFSGAIFGLSEEARRLIDNRYAVDGVLNVLVTSLRGAPLDNLTIKSLSSLMGSFNSLESDAEVNISDVYDWAWGHMGRATMEALYGSHSPISPDDLHWIRKFDRGIAGLALDFMPQLIASDALRAQKQLRALLEPFYRARYDELPTISDVIRKRAAFFRELGFENHDIAGMEMTMPWLGTSGPANSLFWLFAHVFSNPDYTQRVRSEMEAITSVTVCKEGRVVAISTKRVNIQCPFLLACFREVLRKYTHFVSHRRVMDDTTIKDSEGHQYLLKKGINVQWSTSVTHAVESVWGDDAPSFVPERFLNVTLQDEKRRRGSHIPFGSGKHLCPGRHLAVTENLGFVGVLAVGFDVEGAHVPDSEDPVLGTGARTPVFNSKRCNVKIKRRIGWEDVMWKFVE